LANIIDRLTAPRQSQTRSTHYPTHLVRLGAEEQQVERYCSDHVNEEPALEVVDGDLARVRDDLVVLVDVRRAEVDEYVDDEHDVDDQIDNRQRVVDVACERIVLPRFHLHIIQPLSGLLHEADTHLSREMANNKQHCIHQLLPPTKILPMKLRYSHCLFALPQCHFILYTRSFVLRRSLFDDA